MVRHEIISKPIGKHKAQAFYKGCQQEEENQFEMQQDKIACV